MLNFELPAVCDVSVTNVCNAACDFCGFARDKTLTGQRDMSMPTRRKRALAGTGASVTVSRLVYYDELPDTLRRLGFDDVSFLLSSQRAARVHLFGLPGVQPGRSRPR